MQCFAQHLIIFNNQFDELSTNVRFFLLYDTKITLKLCVWCENVKILSEVNEKLLSSLHNNDYYPTSYIWSNCLYFAMS